MWAHEANEAARRWDAPSEWSAGPSANAFARHVEAAETRHHPSAAILFADIVGFTRLCENLTPDAAFRLLHGFHAAMARVATLHGAAICDPIGDGVLAVWTGSDGDDNAARALASGFAMRDAVAAARFAADLAAERLRIGVGIHSGPVTVGRTGGALRAKLSAFGDAVNVANRLERLTRIRDAAVVASDTLLRRAAAWNPGDARLFRFGPGEDVTLAGRSAVVRVRTAAL